MTCEVVTLIISVFPDNPIYSSVKRISSTSTYPAEVIVISPLVVVDKVRLPESMVKFELPTPLILIISSESIVTVPSDTKAMDDVLPGPRAPIVIALPPFVPMLIAPDSLPVPRSIAPALVIINALFVPSHTLKSPSVVLIVV